MSKFHYLIITCFIVFSIISVYICIPGEDNFYKSADEGYYFRFASIIAEKGISQFPFLIKYYTDNDMAYLYPIPSRVGHVLLTASWFKLFGTSFVSLAKFSFFCYLLFVLACFYFSRKFFDRSISYPFALLLSSSPLVMAMGKRALSDSNFNLFCALSIWTFMDFLITNKRNKFFVFLVIYSFCITVKESSLVLLVFFIVFFLLHKYYYKNAISNLYIFCIMFIPLFIGGVSYVILFGGLANFVDLIKAFVDTHFGSDKLNPYAVLFSAGPWYRYIIDYLLLNPVGTLLFIGYCGYFLVSRKWEWKIVYFLLYFVIFFAILSSLKYGKVVRLIINLDMVIHLFSIFMLYSIFRHDNSKKQTQIVFISVLVIFLINYITFLYLFYQLNIYTPISYWLLIARKLIPYNGL